MKPIASPLQILDFAVTSFEFDLVGANEPDVDPTQFFYSYPLSIDFGIVRNDLIKVFIKAEVNRLEEKLPGYSLVAEVACFYRFDEGIELSKDIKESLEGFSTIYIALNSLRGIITNFTANAPFGRYILPSIDLNDLIKNKQAAIREEKKSATKTKNVKTKKVK